MLMELIEGVLNTFLDRPFLAFLAAAGVVGALYLTHLSELLRRIGRWTQILALVVAVVAVLTVAGALTGAVSIGELQELWSMVGLSVGMVVNT